MGELTDTRIPDEGTRNKTRKQSAQAHALPNRTTRLDNIIEHTSTHVAGITYKYTHIYTHTHTHTDT